MNSLPYFKNFPDDYLSGSIRFCSYETQGIFAILTNILWKRGGYLPNNIQEISLISGVESICLTNALEQLKQKQSICFSDDNKIYVKFILEQLQERQKIHIIKTECGKLGLGKPHKQQRVKRSKHKQSICHSKSKAYAVLRAYGSNSIFLESNLKEELRVLSFLEIWDSWLDYRKSRKLPNTERALKLHLEIVNRYSVSDAIEVIKTAIQSNWQGLFPLKGSGNKPAPKSMEEQLAEMKQSAEPLTFPKTFNNENQLPYRGASVKK
jgi:hypothetical protein